MGCTCEPNYGFECAECRRRTECRDILAQRDALLVALKEIVATYEAYDAMTGQGHEDCIDIATAAIRQAEGDSSEAPSRVGGNQNDRSV